MPKGAPESLRALVRALGPASATAPNDGQLLERFCEDRDESAFAALVERHGPMVLSVCLRVLGSPHDAEDAFQATFLVLARRATAIGNPHLLSNWLYGVAWRTASRARVAAARRRAHETNAGSCATMSRDAKVDTGELRSVVDEELNRLPARYRAPLVLCYLEGRTQDEAAAQLGWAKGVLRSRLDRGRDKLRKRLLRRGFGVAAAALTVGLAEDAAGAAITRALVQRTASAAVAFAAGMPLAGTLSGTAVLARGVVDAMFLTKLKLSGLLFFTACLLGSGVLWGRPAFIGRANSAPAVSSSASVFERPLAQSTLGHPASAQAPRSAPARDIRDQLEQKIDRVGFDQGTRLPDALELISDKYDLTIRINEPAFKEMTPGWELEETKVLLPVVTNVTVRQALGMLFEQAGVQYVVQNNDLIVVPQAWVDRGMPFRQLIDANFKQTPLREAFEKLSRQTGTTIILDERVAKGSDEAVTLRLQRVPLVTAVFVLADMKGLRAVPLSNLLYVTSKQNADAFETQQAPALRKLERNPSLPPPSVTGRRTKASR
jgi:RNA polymerase sigma factor (sigma-70 family)